MYLFFKTSDILHQVSLEIYMVPYKFKYIVAKTIIYFDMNNFIMQPTHLYSKSKCPVKYKHTICGPSFYFDCVSSSWLWSCDV